MTKHNEPTEWELKLIQKSIALGRGADMVTASPNTVAAERDKALEEIDDLMRHKRYVDELTGELVLSPTDEERHMTLLAKVEFATDLLGDNSFSINLRQIPQPFD